MKGRTQRSPTAVVAQRGRPTTHAEPFDSITMSMPERHVGYLDVMSVLIRMRHHKAVSRAELIRALIEFMERSGIDFTQFATGDDIVDYMTDYFSLIPNRGRLPLLLDSSLFHPERAEREQRSHTNQRIDVVPST